MLFRSKAYLDNPQQGVDFFEVTHGYNLITANRSWHLRYLSVMAGGGLVVTFPHSTIRGRALNPTIDLSGVTGQVAVSRRLRLARHLFAVGEAKITRSWATVPVVNGSASVPNLAVHLIAGLGVGR